jgi:hypothetical protein
MRSFFSQLSDAVSRAAYREVRLVDQRVADDGGIAGAICQTSRGRPARTSSSRVQSAVSAVCVSGFCTTVLPAAGAGNTSSVGRAGGSAA